MPLSGSTHIDYVQKKDLDEAGENTSYIQYNILSTTCERLLDISETQKQLNNPYSFVMCYRPYFEIPSRFEGYSKYQVKETEDQSTNIIHLLVTMLHLIDSSSYSLHAFSLKRLSCSNDVQKMNAQSYFELNVY